MSNNEITGLPNHPGALLRNRLGALNRSTASIARMLVLSRQTLHEILTEKQSITANVALRIAKLTGTRAEMWLNAQQAYDLAIARSRLSNVLPKVPPLEERW